MWAVRVPPDFGQRVAEAARRAQLSPSDWLRAVVEVNTQPPGESVAE